MMLSPYRLALLFCTTGLLMACEPNYSARDALLECRTLYAEADRLTDANLASEALMGYRGPHVPSMTAILVPQKAQKPRKVEDCDDILILDRRLPE
ncbi:hypothetical protein [Thioclava sp. GXIMD4216]|uniref:hypothetical protein n=1 Tax=Thioclava sp. GXIMD4216 TaxID=3131929 RepID=UPI0030D01B92